MTTELRIVTASLVALIGFGVTAARDDKTPKAFDDAAFLKKAASSGMMEVKLGQLAKGRAESSDVRKFAEQMVTDHTKANKDLAAVAKGAGVALPTKMMAEHQKHYDMLEKMKKGADFDAAYIKHMVKGHETDVKEFTDASTKAKDEDVRKLAKKLLPTLKEHLKMAKSIHAKVGKTDR